MSPTVSVIMSLSSVLTNELTKGGFKYEIGLDLLL